MPRLPSDFIDRQINTSVSFEKLLENYESLEGQRILLGGEMLSSQRAENGTMFEILELPISDSYAPVMDHTRSGGRFLVFDPDLQDREKLAVGSRLTIIGTVKGRVPEPKSDQGPPLPLLIGERVAIWPSWPGPSAFGPFATNCGPFRGFWPFGGTEPFTGRIYPTC
jgi:hypothetical protein